jgi:hypothetical protein
MKYKDEIRKDIKNDLKNLKLESINVRDYEPIDSLNKYNDHLDSL